MKTVILLVLLLVYSIVAMARQSWQAGSKKEKPPRAMCDAAAPKLRESGTNEVVLTMTIDTRGRVQTFGTESPKGLRLEKMKEPAAAIKAMQFEPAKKDGQPVMVMVGCSLHCSELATDASKKP